MTPTVQAPVASDEQIKKLGEFLRDPEKPLKARFRALFTLRNINSSLSINQIGECFADSSALLKHELAYCLGQMRSEDAVPILTGVLGNMSEHPMVRHEAGNCVALKINLDIWWHFEFVLVLKISSFFSGGIRSNSV